MEAQPIIPDWGLKCFNVYYFWATFTYKILPYFVYFVNLFVSQTGIYMAMWVNCGSIKVLMMVIFPNMVRYLNFQLLKISCIFCILFPYLQCMSDKVLQNWMPKSLNIEHHFILILSKYWALGISYQT